MDIDIKAIVYGKNVVEFVTVANEYCTFVENAADFEKTVFVDKSLKILSLLYLKALLLPSIESGNDEDVEKFVTEFDWQIVKNGIASVLADSDAYVDNFDQFMNETPEPVRCNISENMADIFQDLKDFLEIYKLGNEDISYEALFICNTTFADYWGFKLTNAMKMLHLIKFAPQSENEGEQKSEQVRKTDAWFISKAQQDYNQHD